MKNERGLTLVELIATIAIASLALIFIISILIVIQKQYSSNTESTKQLTDISIAMKSITRDLRSAELVNIPNDYSLEIEHANGKEISYQLHGRVLQKNSSNYLYEIAHFKVEEDNNKITVEIENIKGKKLRTEIVVREGV